MNNYWVGVISGISAASILFACMMFVQVEQTNKLRAEVKELREKVSEHDDVVESYKFYNWHNMKFFDEKESE